MGEKIVIMAIFIFETNENYFFDTEHQSLKRLSQNRYAGNFNISKSEISLLSLTTSFLFEEKGELHRRERGISPLNN